MPTSDAAKFLMKGASVIADVLGDDPIGDTLDQETKL